MRLGSYGIDIYVKNVHHSSVSFGGYGFSMIASAFVLSGGNGLAPGCPKACCGFVFHVPGYKYHMMKGAAFRKVLIWVSAVFKISDEGSTLSSSMKSSTVTWVW